MKNVLFKERYLRHFDTQEKIKAPKPLKIIMYMISITIISVILLLVFVPWTQTAHGFGNVIAISPNQRPQVISATVPGRIKQWYVHEGDTVKKDEVIAEIVDNDPELQSRLELQLEAGRSKLEAAVTAAETARLDVDRKQTLYDKGLVSRRDLEKARIDYNDYKAKAAEAEAALADVSKLRSRQEAQVIRAPGDGTVVNLRTGQGSTYLKEGDEIASFIPADHLPAVEIYVRGLDVPLISKGTLVRLQFEGWPAVQVSGWPSVSVGTFLGKVISIDPNASPTGLFRVIIAPLPDEKWPNRNFLRFGARAQGWVLLQEVRLGYELWRQLNSFPPLPAPGTQKEYTGLQNYKDAAKP